MNAHLPAGFEEFYAAFLALHIDFLRLAVRFGLLEQVTVGTLHRHAWFHPKSKLKDRVLALTGKASKARFVRRDFVQSAEAIASHFEKVFGFKEDQKGFNLAVSVPLASAESEDSVHGGYEEKEGKQLLFVYNTKNSPSFSSHKGKEAARKAGEVLEASELINLIWRMDGVRVCVCKHPSLLLDACFLDKFHYLGNPSS